MNIVIPMAGLGYRFKESGFSLPKPLIKIIEKPMYRYAVDCLPLNLASNVVFVLRESDYSEEIERDINNNYNYLSNYSIIKLQHETRGQAETVLLAGNYLNLNEPTLIHNCDTYINDRLNWEHLLSKQIDGAIVLFSSNENRWSYAKLDDNKEYIIEFKEKKVISSHASTGTYFFRDTRELLYNIANAIHADIRENNEFYLSTIYQLMLNQGKKIIPIWADRMLCFGTPPDLVMSLNAIIVDKAIL